MKVRKRRIQIVLLSLCLFIFAYLLIAWLPNSRNEMIDVVGLNVSVTRTFAKEKKLELKVKEEYSDTVKKDIVMKQSIKKGSNIKEGKLLTVTISKGKDLVPLYRENQVNELGDIPIIMYHDFEKEDDKSKVEGGTLDGAKIVRTLSALKEDLKYFYDNDYRVISLKDMIDGMIDVPMGKSPIVLTFDGGYEHQIRVTGEEENGKLKIDPDCSVGILEAFQKEHKDMQVTATFFLNDSLFQQKKYNKKIIKWLVENGYDIGNGTLTGADITTLDYAKTQQEIGGMYQILDQLIPEKYVKFVSLPGGSPYQVNHKNYDAILEGTYEKNHYQTNATLQNGSSANQSPFSQGFSTDFIKRIKAYNDEEQKDTLKYNFEQLKKTRYISDGDENHVVVPKEKKELLSKRIQQEVIIYES